jgi:hypothetical protein
VRDDNQITCSQQVLFDRIQNITLLAGGKPDGCDAEEYAHAVQTRAERARSAVRALAWTLLPFRRVPNTHFEKETSVMLWTILVILLVLWLVGLLTHVGGGLIHLLLVVAVVVLVINLVTGRRAV